MKSTTPSSIWTTDHIRWYTVSKSTFKWVFLLLINYVKDQELQAGEKMSNAFTENQKMLYGALNEKQKKSTVLIIKDR